MHASWTSPFPCGQRGCGGLSKRAGIRAGPRAVRARELAQRERRSLPCLGAARRSLPRSSDSLCRRCGSVRRGERRHGISLTLRCGPWRKSARSRWRAKMTTRSSGVDARGRLRRERGSTIVSSLHGRLGGVGFCAASWQARDEFVGWTHGLPTSMVNNYRFLLLPGVRVHRLASRVLDLAAARLTGKPPTAHDRPTLNVSPDQPCYREAGALQQADVGDAAGSRGEGRRAVGEAAGHRLEGATVSEAGTDDRPCPGAPRSDGGTGVRAQHVTAGGAWWGVRGRRVWEARPGQPDDLPGETGQRQVDSCRTRG